jgi:hypothetical protein
VDFPDAVGPTMATSGEIFGSFMAGIRLVSDLSYLGKSRGQARNSNTTNTFTPSSKLPST